MFVFTDTRVIHATASLEKAEQSAWFLSNNDTRMSVVRPPSQFLLVAPFRTKKKKVLMSTGKDEQKKKIPQFLVGCPLTATAGIHTNVL